MMILGGFPREKYIPYIYSTNFHELGDLNHFVIILGSRIIYPCIKQTGIRIKGQGLRIRPRLLTVRQDPTLLVEVDGGS